MRSTRTRRLTRLALLPLLLISIYSTDIAAQQYNGQPYGSQYQQRSPSQNTTPRIDGFNVNEVARLTPGTELNFSLWGTPSGSAMLRIEGAQHNLNLLEHEPGQYEGTYTISVRDSINARSAVTANMRVGNQVASAVLAESLQRGVGRRAQDRNANRDPDIKRFEVQPSADLSRGNELTFTVFGTPGGKAEISIGGARGTFFLTEVESGRYSALYTIKRGDRIASNSVVTATLKVGDRSTTSTLGRPLLVASAPVPAIRMCMSCGTIEAINLVETRGDGGYLGTIGGGVVGGLLGNQVGGGNGRTLATVAGVLGGALAGRAIEGKSRAEQHYEIVVRMQNGSGQTVALANDGGFHTGDKVRITDGVLSREK